MKTLKYLIDGLPEYKWVSGKNLDPQINRIQNNPQAVGHGDLFVAITGKNYDTHAALPLVWGQKPSAVVVEKLPDKPWPSDIPLFLVPRSRQALGFLAQRFYDEPSQQLFCVGVTGTNGKTSTTTMIEFLLQQFAVPTAKVGTLGAFLQGEGIPLKNTTPGALELAHLLKLCADKNMKAVTMEVSSHALDQFRVDGIHFDSVCFLNLSRDHLDYHGTMENYFAAKARLFSEVLYFSNKNPKWAAIHLLDDWGWKVRVDASAAVITFGPHENCDVRYRVLDHTLEGVTFEIRMGQQRWDGFLPLLGDFQVGNLAAALCTLLPKGLELGKAIHFMQSFPGVPGRMQRVTHWSIGHVFIDYAHTPDALTKSLKTLAYFRQSGEKRQLGLVFGCGGDRDPGKRPLMGQVASQWADWIILTSDNPRSEDPLKIIENIQSGIPQPCEKPIFILPDRREAIHKALSLLNKDDMLLIAGKGHEKYQEIQGVQYPFSDWDVVLQAGGRSCE